MQAPNGRAPELNALLRRVLSQELRALAGLIEAAHSSLERDPIPESGRGRLTAWYLSEEAAGLDQVGNWERLEHELIDDVMVIGAGINDHLAALQLCLTAEIPLQTSIVTLGRAIFEPTVRLCYLLDARVAPVQHLLRAVAQWVDKFESTEKTARSYDHDPHELAEIAGRTDRMHADLSTMGFMRFPGSRNPRFTTNVGLGGEVVNVDFNVTEAAKRYVTGVDFAWSVLSGGAHSKSWFINSAYGFEGEDNSEITKPDETHSLVIALLLSASDAFVDAVCSWVGINPASLHQKTHLRRIAVLQGLASEVMPFRSYAEYSAVFAR